MMKVVNIKDPYQVYGGRPRGGKDPRACKPGEYGWLGNPFHLASEADREVVIQRFKVYFWRRINSDVEYREAVMALRGKTVACFCSPKHCHLDILVDWFNAGCPLRS